MLCGCIAALSVGAEPGAPGASAPADLRACLRGLRACCGDRRAARADGTVLVLCPGHEMGQGLFTKVRQTAAMALSNVLPAGQRPFPIDLINIADNASDLLPNAGARPASSTLVSC